jgi:uncharacterized membrane protein YbaN (DUF454 family)
MTQQSVHRYLFLISGFVSLGLGVAGLVLPFLPGTPFLILAAFCFSRSSERFHLWLIRHKHFGPPIKAWGEYGAIHLPAKIISTVAMLGSAALVFSREDIPLAGKVAYGLTLIAVMVYIWTRPSGPGGSETLDGL